MKTILVVEDELSIAEIVRVTLEDEGYHVLTAANGRDGLALLAKSTPDLVLADVMMPGLDGRQLCRAIRANPAYDATPVVLMTAVAESIKKADCGYSAILSKPFSLDVLLETVGDLIGGTSELESG